MRYPVLKPDEMTSRQREVAEAIGQRRAGGLAGPYVPLIYSPEVADRMQQLSEYLRFSLRVPERLRLMAILITVRHKNADYPFHIHTDSAREAGLSETMIAALSEASRPADMSADEAMIYDYCTELTRTGGVKDATFGPVAERFGREICLELVALCGYYALLAMVANVVETKLPESVVTASA
jgi:4-carboxymuconolactone decarboxylase